MLNIVEFAVLTMCTGALYHIAMAFKDWYSTLGYTTYMQDDYPWIIPKNQQTGLDEPQNAFPIVWSDPYPTNLGTYGFDAPPPNILSEAESFFGIEGTDYRIGNQNNMVFLLPINGAFDNRFSDGFNVGELPI